MKKTLRLILGDQLNINHSWFQSADESVTYTMMELRSETDYAIHHIQKVVGFFSAMRNFASELQQNKHQLIYIQINETVNLQAFDKNIQRLIEENEFDNFEYQYPDEYRLDELLKNFCKRLKIKNSVVDSEHFMSSRKDLGDFFEGKKTFVMEPFYRMMRKKHHILMQGDQPITGKWNYDEENRKKLPKNHLATPPLIFNNAVTDIVLEIHQANIKTIGKIDSQGFIWPTTREQSLELVAFFVTECLALFGTYQDAMSNSDWSLFHSRISFSMNLKLISPLEVINSAIQEWEKNPNKIAYNQLEGFVRQIIGWREFMRGVYWNKMPQFASLNYFNNENKLPAWFWTGKTKMNCLKESINQSLKFAYAHHIQRLMVTGNFALLAGTNPDEVDAWYLGIYIDAIEWVEITNTRGMSQFADGGIVGTKPYVSSAAYIDKMGHYCGSCFYKKAIKVGDKACPFNSLYWNFYNRNEEKLGKNPRVGMMYTMWRKMKPEDKTALLEQADYYLKRLDDL